MVSIIMVFVHVYLFVDPKPCVPLKLPEQNSIKKPFDEPDTIENAEEVASGT